MTVDSNADEAAIRRADAELVAAINARDIDRWLSGFAPDARLLPPNSAPIVGKAAIRAFMAGLLTVPKFLMENRDKVVDVSSGGDMASVVYRHALTIWDPQGIPITDQGNNVTIYRKGADGLWKIVVDIWNEVAPGRGDD